jgi:hypothetical protein
MIESEIKVTSKPAGRLEPGDILANLGIVTKTPTEVGVFVVIRFRGTIWSLADGAGDLHEQDVVFHCMTDVLVEQP